MPASTLVEPTAISRIKAATHRLMRRIGRFASLLLGASAIFLVWFGAIYGINREYQDAEKAARANGENLARAFEEQMIRSLRAVDQTILYVRDTYARNPAHFDISLWSRNSQFLSDFNFQIAIIDKDGFLSASNIDPNAARVDLSDREHFKVHKNGTEDFLFISKPLLGRVSNKWSVQITRRIVMPDGTFGGVVVVSLDPNYLSRFYESIDIGSSGTVTLVGTDGIIRARSVRGSGEQGIGQSVAKSVLFEELKKAPAGSYESNAVIDGILRIYSYRRVAGYPLVVSVGQGHDEILTAFNANRRLTLIGALLITAWIVVVLLLIQRYQNDLARARDAAEAGTRARSEFLAMMSHEIRTPMNGVIGIADLLADSGLPEQQRRMVDTLRDSAGHLLQIINDVLDFSKLDGSAMEIEAIAFGPRNLVASAVQLFAPPASTKGVNVRADIAPDVPDDVIGDPARIRQVLFNLVGNAVKFTPSGSVTIRLTREEGVDAASPQLVFSVEDTGIGISEEARARLFQEFSQVDSSIARRFGGTGLGLAICKRIVERLGGEIDVTSEIGKGSVFRFALPVALGAPNVDAPALVPEIDGGDAPAAIRPLRILLAEDNLTNQMVATKIIAKLGHEVTVVANGAQALGKVQNGDFDLILMDMMMPEIDGLTATRTIRKLTSAVRNIHIIALTANAFREDDAQCRAAGMDDFVAKPVTREQLAAALHRYIVKAGLERPIPVAVPVPPAVESLALFDQRPPEAFDPAKLVELRHAIGPEGTAEVLDTFMSDTVERFKLIRVSIAAGNRAVVKNEVHALKGSAATLGFMRMSALARALEMRTREQLPDDVTARVDEIAAAFDEVKEIARNENLAA